MKPKDINAEVLRAARKAAGFPSAANAAQRNGWPVATYRAQEAGTRPIRPEEASLYERTFGIPQGSLLEKPRHVLGQLMQDAAFIEQQRTTLVRRNKKAAGFRLKLARILRGHASSAAFADKNSLKGSTCASHEAGNNTISPEYAELYAIALGVEKNWLLNGTLPSALGPKVDARIEGWSETVGFDPHPWVGLADPAPPVDASRVAEAKRRAEEAGLPSLEIRELSSHVLADESLALPARNFPSRWRIPAGVLDGIELDIGNMNVVALALEEPTLDLRAGDRIFVDIRDIEMAKPGLFACLAGTELRIVDIPGSVGRRVKPSSSLKPLGRIVGMFKQV